MICYIDDKNYLRNYKTHDKVRKANASDKNMASRSVVKSYDLWLFVVKDHKPTKAI